MDFTPQEFTNHLELRFHVAASSNALSLLAARELSKLRREYARWRKPVVVTTGHATVFCSGGNLSDYKKMRGKAPGLKVNREITKHLDGFGAWAVPKLAVVTGDVLGGGMEWLARFDFRLATPHVLFSFWQRRVGLSTGWGGGSAWADKIGEDRMRQLLLEGRLLSAERALHLGLIDRLALQPDIETWAARMSSETVNALVKWRSGAETKVFQSLWQTGEHKSVLSRWKS